MSLQAHGFATIGGLMPLVFETSLQAQFLKPMAVSISIGLAFAAVQILLFILACMCIHGSPLRFFAPSRRSVRPRPARAAGRTIELKADAI